MRVLILFSLWAPDGLKNSKKWLDYYVGVMKNQFPDDDKFISINGNHDYIVDDIFDNVKNIIEISRVPADMVINSDASGYQHALKKCESIIKNYDAVCFFHAKGISYDFPSAGGIRIELDNSVFDRAKLLDGLSKHDRSLVAIKGYVSPSLGANRHFNRLAASAGLPENGVHYCATLTLFAVHSGVLLDLLGCLPDKIKNQNLVAAGENRYFFEAMFPSLLSAKGATPVFLCGERLEPSVSNFISFDALPAHNSAIVANEFRKRQAMGEAYQCPVIPYVFAGLDEIKGLQFVYDLT